MNTTTPAGASDVPIRKYLWVALPAVVILLFFLLPSFASVYTDWLWF